MLSLFGSTIGKALNYGLSKARQREDTNLKMALWCWYEGKPRVPHGIPTPRYVAWLDGQTDLTRQEWIALERWLKAEPEEEPGA